jgi:hypothetical protein
VTTGGGGALPLPIGALPTHPATLNAIANEEIKMTMFFTAAPFGCGAKFVNLHSKIH